MRALRSVLAVGVLLAAVLAAVPSTAHAATSPGGAYTGIAPFRAVDRLALGPGAAGAVQVAGRGGVPVGATAVAANVTIASATAPTFVAAWPSGQPRPATSVANTVAGHVVASTVQLALGSDGAVALYNSAGTVAVDLDVVGWFGPSGARFTALAPTRILDTRTSSAPLGAGESRVVAVAGSGGVPSGATAVVVNLTGTAPTAPTYLTAYAAGDPLPPTSNLNLGRGETAANLATIALTNGALRLYNRAGSTHAILDVVGYYGSSGLLFTGVTPSRVLDTRSGVGRPAAAIGAKQTVHVATGTAGPPSTAKAVVATVTAIAPTAASYLAAYPTAASGPPATSTVNVGAGGVAPNLAVVPVGSDLTFGLYNAAGGADAAVDVTGYYASAYGGAAPVTAAPSYGPAWQVLYAVPRDVTPDPSTVPAIRHEMGVVGDWFAGQTAATGNVRPRLVSDLGAIQVTTVVLDRTAAQLDGDDPGNVDASLRDAGYLTHSGRVVVYGEFTSASFCGLTYGGSNGVSTSATLLYMRACGGIRPTTDSTFPYGATYLVAHELTHGFGAVPSCAPHYDGTGHVDDDPRDVLYEGNQDRDWDHITLDPGHDDYYATGRTTCADIASSPYWTS